MKKGTSKAKGNAFEIQICRKLTKWVIGKERPEIFWRSASSGAKATASRKAGHKTNMHGDIMACAPEGNFLTDRVFIECKHYKSIKIEALLEEKGVLLDWLRKLILESEDANKHFWLIFKGNHKNPLILLDLTFFNDVEEIVGSTKWSPLFYKNLIICKLDSFLDWATPESLKMIFNREGK